MILSRMIKYMAVFCVYMCACCTNVHKIVWDVGFSMRRQVCWVRKDAKQLLHSFYQGKTWKCMPLCSCETIFVYGIMKCVSGIYTHDVLLKREPNRTTQKKKRKLKWFSRWNHMCWRYEIMKFYHEQRQKRTLYCIIYTAHKMFERRMVWWKQ